MVSQAFQQEKRGKGKDCKHIRTRLVSPALLAVAMPAQREVFKPERLRPWLPPVLPLAPLLQRL